MHSRGSMDPKYQAREKESHTHTHTHTRGGKKTLISRYSGHTHRRNNQSALKLTHAHTQRTACTVSHTQREKHACTLQHNLLPVCARGLTDRCLSEVWQTCLCQRLERTDGEHSVLRGDVRARDRKAKQSERIKKRTPTKTKWMAGRGI